MVDNGVVRVIVVRGVGLDRHGFCVDGSSPGCFLNLGSLRIVLVDC